MTDKVWFITGTSRGFGREWAVAALDRGDRVAATARNTDSLQDLREKYGEAVLPLRLDVTDRTAVTAAVQQASSNSVASTSSSTTPDMGSSAWSRRPVK